MFRWFTKRQRNKPIYGSLMNLSHEDFIRAVSSTVCGSDRTSNSMLIVAVANLRVMLPLMIQDAGKAPEGTLPTNTDEAIRFFERAIINAQSEAGRMRLEWFLLATFIQKASEFAQKHNLEAELTPMWLKLSEDCVNIKHILTKNILWEETEKEFFENITTDWAARHYVMCLLMPKTMRKQKDISLYCEQHGISLNFC